jgi:hypothetical protein
LILRSGTPERVTHAALYGLRDHFDAKTRGLFGFGRPRRHAALLERVGQRDCLIDLLMERLRVDRTETVA